MSGTDTTDEGQTSQEGPRQEGPRAPQGQAGAPAGDQADAAPKESKGNAEAEEKPKRPTFEPARRETWWGG